MNPFYKKVEGGKGKRDLTGGFDVTETADGDQLVRRTYSPEDAISLYPNPLNGIVLNNGPDNTRLYLGPEIYGPKIKLTGSGDEVDIIATAVRNKLREEAGLTYQGVDDYWTHHVRLGEVHCGTNSVRALTNIDWWPSVAPLG